mmetsp:Transcript_36850/g.82563  ORF Transcript_36850/g.82563 Transcript_36850/m.82563 type:complete len:302 (+) Transcript_36850:1411-2316(+)
MVGFVVEVVARALLFFGVVEVPDEHLEQVGQNVLRVGVVSGHRLAAFGGRLPPLLLLGGGGFPRARALRAGRGPRRAEQGFDRVVHVHVREDHQVLDLLHKPAQDLHVRGGLADHQLEVVVRHHRGEGTPLGDARLLILGGPEAEEAVLRADDAVDEAQDRVGKPHEDELLGDDGVAAKHVDGHGGLPCPGHEDRVLDQVLDLGLQVLILRGEQFGDSAPVHGLLLEVRPFGVDVLAHLPRQFAEILHVGVEQDVLVNELRGEVEQQEHVRLGESEPLPLQVLLDSVVPSVMCLPSFAVLV